MVNAELRPFVVPLRLQFLDENWALVFFLLPLAWTALAHLSYT